MADPTPVEMKRAAFGALQVLKDNLPENCKLSIEDEDEFVISALKRHGAHLTTHTISQRHVDPFKLLCWIGCAIIQNLEIESYAQHELILTALINSLEETLMLETDSQVKIAANDRVLIHRLMMEEIKGNGVHGIGFNGLFVAFHCLRASYKQINGINEE